MKRSVVLVIVALIIGLVVGYGTGYITYEPKITSLETQVSDLTSEVSRLNQAVSNQQAQISSQGAQILALESERSRLQTEKAKLQSDVTNYKGQVTTLKSEMSSLQDRLDKILSVTVTQHYEWIYGRRTWKWELPMPLSLYVEYLERSRPQLGASYVNMAKDPKDDLYIDRMIQQINSAAIQEGFSESKKVNFVIAFVQSLPYTVDIETTPYDEYPRYPIQTLFDRGGDCEDTSILVAALLDKMGYDVVLLWLRDAQHIAVGVSIAGTYGTYYEHDGKKYFFLETTGEGWQIGQFPPSITYTQAYIYPVGS